MSDEKRNFYFRTYGVQYVKDYADDLYEYGSYQAVDNPEVKIIYKFRLVDIQ